jgi:hypothetical protein
MKKSNIKVSQSKMRRSMKNKKRLKDKVVLSKFERKQIVLRESIMNTYGLHNA